MHVRLVIIACALLLAGCGGSNLAIPPTDDFGANASINWDRSPDAVVFRAEIVGGGREAEFASRDDIAPCTVYGDNRVVWTNELGAFNEQVLFDQVSDDAIRLFIETLTVVDRLFSYPARAELQLPSSIVPVYEQISINVSGSSFQSDAFSGWPANYFDRVVERCRTISQTPVLFEPSAGWFSVLEVPYDLQKPAYPWDAAAAGIALAELAASGQRRWVTEPLSRVIWNLVRTSPPDVQLIENDRAYHISLEVPRVTRYSPPPP